MGRFLTRDTWPGEVNRPHSLNRWGYVEGNPVMTLDPSGNMPLPPGSFPPTFPLLTNPDRARKIQNVLYLLGDPSKAGKDWDKFLDTYQKKWAESGNSVWWLKRIWKCPTVDDLRLKQFSYLDNKVEIVMAIAMAKEWSGFINDSYSQPLWSEAIGRRYWQNCSSYPCEISENWTSTNAFLNFLSYDQSIQDATMTDYSLVFMTPSIRNTALMIAARIRQQGLGRGGQDDDRPYHYFCTDCTAGKSADWLTKWLDKNAKNPKLYGTSSYSKDGFQQVVFARGAEKKYVLILTPRQQRDLCGNRVCFDPNLPKPSWLKE